MTGNYTQRILVVDDNPHNLRALSTILSAQGYEVASAYDGIEALDRVEETVPDLIVLDIIMPRLNGFDVTKALRGRESSRHVPILMVTALNELGDRVKGLDVGADDFVSRPFHSVELLARVRSLLRIKQLHDKLQSRNALLERLLTRYVSDDVTREILENPTPDLRLGDQSCELSVLFAKICGFTRFSETHAAPTVTQALNFIFHHLATLIFEHQGTLDKYLGNALMAFYGAPLPSSNHARQALCTAWAMQRRFAQLSREDHELAELGLSIGLGAGPAIVGRIGSERVMDYTVLGRTPATARRLQERAAAGQILIDEHTYQAVQEIVVVQPVEMPAENEAQAYQVLAVKEKAGG
jgi:DNA-binding response OmpR family regulator